MASLVDEAGRLSEPTLSALARAVASGDASLWPDLVAKVHPLAVALCKQRRIAGGREDLAGDCALRVLDILAASDHAALRRYCDAADRLAELSFEAWLSTIVSHAAVDVVRGLPGASRRRDGGGKRVVELATIEPFDEHANAATGIAVENAIELRRIISLIVSPEFPERQRRVLALWLDGHRASEIAELLDLEGSRSAEKLLRAARQRLRRLHLGEPT